MPIDIPNPEARDNAELGARILKYRLERGKLGYGFDSSAQITPSANSNFAKLDEMDQKEITKFLDHKLQKVPFDQQLQSTINEWNRLTEKRTSATTDAERLNIDITSVTTKNMVKQLLDESARPVDTDEKKPKGIKEQMLARFEAEREAYSTPKNIERIKIDNRKYDVEVQRATEKAAAEQSKHKS